jgi:hypothetical protein
MNRLIQVLINVFLGRLAVLLETMYKQKKPHTEHTQTSMPQWDTNPRSQCWSGRGQFVPQTARPLRSALLQMKCEYFQIRKFTSSFTMQYPYPFVTDILPCIRILLRVK